MANLKQEIVSALGAIDDLTAIVGTRIYPSAVPQTATPGEPRLTYQFLSSTRDSHLRGPTGIVWTRVRFRAWSTTHGDLEDIFQAVRVQLQGLPGDLGTVEVLFVIFDPETDDYTEPLEGSDLGTHCKTFDVRIKSREALPVNADAAPVAPSFLIESGSHLLLESSDLLLLQ